MFGAQKTRGKRASFYCPLPGSYKHHCAVENMLEALSGRIYWQDVEKANFISIVSVESNVVAVLKKLMVVLGRARVYFISNMGKANTIVASLKEVLKCDNIS